MNQAVARFIRPLPSREIWSFVGLVVLACFVWLAGPLFAFAEIRPLESGWVRAATIAVLFAAWGARVAWRSWHASRLNAQLLNQLREAAPGPANADDPAKAQLDELRSRFDEAAALLKKVRFGQADTARKGLARWFDRMSRQYLYQLPWYVFIGAPGSGKTTALVNSGLSFPLAEQFGRAAIRGVGGTRHCDWWFTNDAVLIDTAGRYTTHEGNRALDEAEWKGFVELLKKYRTRQPLNGAMLTISVADLVGASEAERTQHAMVLRKRLLELRAQLGIRFPVYLLVTKADLLAGFAEYFGGFGRAECAQVWGFTFPLAQSEAPGFDLRAAFDREYRLLHQRLNDGLPELLATQTDARQREMAYLLPQQVADLQDMLGQFVAEVFSVSSFEPMPMLRGVYLTSGTQEGTAFDRVMSGIKRFLKIEGMPPVAQVGSTGRSFFLKSLLQEHIFREAALAGSDLRWHQKRRVLQIAGYALLAVVSVVVLAAWLRSYANNRAYLDRIAQQVPAVDAQIAGAKFSDAADIARLLPVLDALGGLANAGGVDRSHPPLAYRWGLFQGEKIDEAVDVVYRRALDDVLLPIAARRMEAALSDARPDETDYAYAALKAYLMLYDSAHYDPAFVQAVVDLEMERSLPPDFSPAERSALRAHLAALFGNRVAVSPYPMNERLVADVRDRLRQVPFSQRLYRQLTRTLRPATSAFDFSVARAVGPDASLVFRRQSGKPLSEGVPGLYTRNGYRNVFAPRLAGEVDAYGREEVWVLNLGLSEIPGPNDAAAWARDIRQLYLNDYLKIWDDYLADIKLQRTATLAQSIQVARALSSADSPLTRLMIALARDTALGDAPGGGRNLASRAQDKVDEARSSLSQIFAGQGASDANPSAAAPASPEQVVDNHFAGLRAFAPGSGDQAQAFDAVLKSIDALYTYLTATDDALRSGAQPPPSDAPARLRAQAGRLPTPFRDVLDDLSNVANGSVATVEQRSVAQRAGANVGDFCRQAIAGRYPFARGSSRDVAPADFAQMFAPGGLMDDFFQKNLQSIVDTTSRPWRFANRNADADPAAAAMLSSFEKAAVIRDVYFGGGARTAQLKVQIQPLEMDPSLTEMVLDVDGQIVRYAHGPLVQSAVDWPGTRGSNQVRLQVSGQAGATDGFTTDGPWALHRLFDRAAVSAGRGSDQMIARFTVDGKPIVLQVNAGSVRNPFRLPQMESFTCPPKQ
ncbi:type VI secretion system membrane subunit TssM [Burkholderia diffusa]|uniref:Putative lipoprotein n=1 Tax=Burkholderia diffusa TaxID=488732 RepID=A0A6P2J626_9BURK|nr:type VI secretion system membrane subunit TssM [Burkholderia diffusa]KAB0662056.1 type VI secretion system membrane subunit TssM [Burkholderia diffusa]MBM2653395.1 type VI secretion system membrane subunit TssM [Burkholderia diffusa]VWB39344.1 putative lipoprotein [Burkholderia diffusa]